MATAKNVITVGAVDDADGTMSDFSNWGPTDDGRIKPNIVAPGVDIWSCSDDDVDGNLAFDDYVAIPGMSMAAPAVTGLVGLLIQSYREKYLSVPDSTLTPLPSTIKALLCPSTSAENDRCNPGPDYQYGYGGVRADAARDLIVNKRLREAVVADSDDCDVYEFEVTAASQITVGVTLAWDDHDAPEGSFYTPWQLYLMADTQTVNPAARERHDASSRVTSRHDILRIARDRWNNVQQVCVEEYPIIHIDTGLADTTLLGT